MDWKGKEVPTVKWLANSGNTKKVSLLPVGPRFDCGKAVGKIQNHVQKTV